MKYKVVNDRKISKYDPRHPLLTPTLVFAFGETHIMVDGDLQTMLCGERFIMLFTPTRKQIDTKICIGCRDVAQTIRNFARRYP